MTTRAAPKKSLPWWAVLLIVFGVLFVLGALAIGGIVWWVASNKDRIVAEGKQSIADAETYAAGHDQNACVNEALRKLDTCPGIMCEAQTKVFLTTCVAHARKTPGFCDGLPSPNEIIRMSSWTIDECVRRGKHGEQRCAQVLQAVPEACRRTP